MRPLAICIPTFERARHLAALLESIASQAGELPAAECLQVVVSDNHSTDGTPDVVRSFLGGPLELISHRQERNLGFAANLNTAVALASARHCWLMGSDDRLAPGALRAVLDALQAHGDVDLLLVDKIVAGRPHRYLRTPGARTLEIRSQPDLLDYVRQCTEISALFAFISTIVVRKRYWDGHPPPAPDGAHPYTHLLRLFRALTAAGGTLRYLDAPLVISGGVQNEYSADVHRHALLDATTLEQVASLFARPEEAREALAGVFRLQYRRTSLILRAKALAAEADWRRAQPLVRAAGYPRIAVARSPLDPLVRVYHWIARSGKRLRRRVRRGPRGAQAPG